MADDSLEGRRRGITPAQQILSACTGATAVSFFVTPLDVIKVRLQALPYQQGMVQPAAAASSSVPCASCGTLVCGSGMGGGLGVLARLIRCEGVLALWSGLQPTLLMNVPGTVIYFTVYEAARDRLTAALRWARGANTSLGPNPTPEIVPLIAGGGSRLLSATIVSPLELMRTRMQAERALAAEGMLGGALSIVRREGASALWRGLAPTLWRDVPFSCVYWGVYEALKRRVPAQQGGEISFGSSFGCGATAGALAAVFTNPFDVAKTRQQVAEGPLTTRGKGTLSLLASIARHEGWGALGAGLVPRLIKVAPSCAVMISSYELGKRFFAQRMEPSSSQD
jgi:solute carrier family 25 protein 39/40